MRSLAASFAILLAFSGLDVGHAAAMETREYDAIGRLHRVTYPNGGTIEYNYDGRGNILSIVTSLSTTGVEPEPAAPPRFALGRPTSIPGSRSVRITFSLPVPEHAVLGVFNVAGRLVATLADARYEAGEHAVQVNAAEWARGVYFYRLVAGDDSATQKLVLFR